MLGSISPVGETSRNQRWWLTASAYAAASTAGGAVAGTVSGALGTVLVRLAPVGVTARLVTLGVVLIAAVVLDTAARGLLPTWHRQVDERWLTTYRGWVYGAGFGAQLGLGVVTIVVSAATYAMLGAAVLTASWRAGLLIGVVFGAVRSVPVLLLAPVRSAGPLHAVSRRVVESETRAHVLTVVGQGVLAVVALVCATTGRVP